MINGVTFSPLKEIRDERGAVLHMLRNDSPEFTTFGECYFSEVFPKAIKAWKQHSVQTQNISVPVGRIRFVLFDNRPHLSEDILEKFELGRPDNYQRITVPPGIWYGFSCIGNESALLVNCADLPHTPGESIVLPYDTDQIPYAWKI